MTWRETARDVHGGVTYVTYRCVRCRKLAVATSTHKPGRCVCQGARR